VKLMLMYQIQIGLTAGVTCQERMLTPPRHLTPYTSIICRGPCKPDFYCGLFHLPDLDTDLDCGYSIYLTGHTDFDCGLFRFPDLYTPILTIEFGAYGECNQSTGDAYSLTPDPTSGFSGGPCLLNFLDLYFIRDLWDWSLFVILLFHSDGKKDDSLVSKTLCKLNIILNLEFWNFNQEAHTGQTSEYWIEMHVAKDP
jgi:hypothetical protein